MSGSPFEPYIYPKRPSREQLPRDNLPPPSKHPVIDE